MTVSILVTGCDDEAHVREALDSVSMQRTTFALEVLVSATAHTPGWETASAYADDALEVIGEPAQEAEGPRLRRLLERARGEYVARLDTCDLWLREDKLQLQVEALEAQPVTSVCVHDTIRFHEDGSEPATELTYESMLKPDGLLSVREPLDPSSVVMRRRSADAYPTWVWRLPAADGALHLIDGLGATAHVSVRGSASRARYGSRSREWRLRRLEGRLELLERIRPLVASRHLEHIAYAASNVRMLLAVEQVLPPDAAVLMLSSGDDELVELVDSVARHFPAEVAGYAGGLPSDGDDAIALLNRGRAEGADYLVVPAAGRWWLEAYPELAACLDASHQRVHVDGDAVVYRLTTEPS